MITNEIDLFKVKEFTILNLIYFTIDLDSYYYRFFLKNDNAKINFQADLTKESKLFCNKKWNKKHLKSFLEIFEFDDFIKMNLLLKDYSADLPMLFKGDFYELAKKTFDESNNYFYSPHLNTMLVIYDLDQIADRFNNQSVLASKISDYWNKLNLEWDIDIYKKKFNERIDSMKGL